MDHTPFTVIALPDSSAALPVKELLSPVKMVSVAYTAPPAEELDPLKRQRFTIRPLPDTARISASDSSSSTPRGDTELPKMEPPSMEAKLVLKVEFVTVAASTLSTTIAPPLELDALSSKRQSTTVMLEVSTALMAPPPPVPLARLPLKSHREMVTLLCPFTFQKLRAPPPAATLLEEEWALLLMKVHP
jgi:hypothetical protein